MTDQVSSSNGQHQRWAESGEYRADSEGSGWQQGGSRGAEGWRHRLTMGGVVFVWLLEYQPLIDDVCDDVLDVIEGIAGETGIELTQEENNMRERYDSG